MPLRIPAPSNPRLNRYHSRRPSVTAAWPNICCDSMLTCGSTCIHIYIHIHVQRWLVQHPYQVCHQHANCHASAFSTRTAARSHLFEHGRLGDPASVDKRHRALQSLNRHLNKTIHTPQVSPCRPQYSPYKRRVEMHRNSTSALRAMP